MMAPPPESTNRVNRITPAGRTVTYNLRVLQQPERARACGSGAKSSADRRPIDPPPIVELTIFSQEGEDVTFSYNANFFLFVTLESIFQPDQPPVPYTPPGTPVLTGSTVSGCAYLDRPSPAGYFIFPDLSVRNEGRYRLCFALYEDSKEPKYFDHTQAASLNEQRSGKFFSQHVAHRLDVYSQPFTVYSAKKFPGLTESTALSRMVAEQGCRVRIRRDVRMRRRDKPADVDVPSRESASPDPPRSATSPGLLSAIPPSIPAILPCGPPSALASAPLSAGSALGNGHPLPIDLGRQTVSPSPTIPLNRAMYPTVEAGGQRRQSIVSPGPLHLHIQTGGGKPEMSTPGPMSIGYPPPSTPFSSTMSEVRPYLPGQMGHPFGSDSPAGTRQMGDYGGTVGAGAGGLQPYRIGGQIPFERSHNMKRGYSSAFDAYPDGRLVQGARPDECSVPSQQQQPQMLQPLLQPQEPHPRSLAQSISQPQLVPQPQTIAQPLLQPIAQSLPQPIAQPLSQSMVQQLPQQMLQQSPMQQSPMQQSPMQQSPMQQHQLLQHHQQQLALQHQHQQSMEKMSFRRADGRISSRYLYVRKEMASPSS